VSEMVLPSWAVKGRRVVPTDLAHRRGIVRPDDKGVIVGFGRRGDCIRVQRNGLKTVTSYHVDYWCPEP
jgi:hypothetical protein